MSGFDEKCRKLYRLMEGYAGQDVAVAFSGGVDSSVILQIACGQAERFGTKVYAATIHTSLHPAGEPEAARRAAEAAGAVHKALDADVLGQAGIEENPVNRCYLCKKYMLTKLKDLAEELGAPVILEGTNADDTREYRPGIQAVSELGIISPLILSGLTKAEVRRLAGALGLSAAQKPSSPCLATRFPYHTKLTGEAMRKVEKLEAFIRGRGFYNVRARIHGELVRIEVDEKDIPRLAAIRKELAGKIRAEGYLYVTVDLEGFRTGSLDAGRMTETW